MAKAYLLLGALAVSASACKEDPSFRMRWTIEGETLSDPTQCAQRGVFDVVALTFDELGFLADSSRYPCFPGSFENPEATVGGPTLPPGNAVVLPSNVVLRTVFHKQVARSPNRQRRTHQRAKTTRR